MFMTTLQSIIVAVHHFDLAIGCLGGFDVGQGGLKIYPSPL